MFATLAFVLCVLGQETSCHKNAFDRTLRNTTPHVYGGLALGLDRAGGRVGGVGGSTRPKSKR